MPIVLTTPYVFAGPNLPSETDNWAAVVGISANLFTQTLGFTLLPLKAVTLDGNGHVTGITPAQLAGAVTVIINCTNGEWSSSNGVNGTISGQNLTGAQGWLNAALTSSMKNMSEPFFASLGIFPGTQLNWA